ncbi:hypothetical protein ID866_7920 [Astraeus odoratus]|nr:hypothetical protein ID866_7920 [Astraeus odoratus]
MSFHEPVAQDIVGESDHPAVGVVDHEDVLPTGVADDMCFAVMKAKEIGRTVGRDDKTWQSRQKNQVDETHFKRASMHVTIVP